MFVVARFVNGIATGVSEPWSDPNLTDEKPSEEAAQRCAARWTHVDPTEGVEYRVGRVIFEEVR